MFLSPIQSPPLKRSEYCFVSYTFVLRFNNSSCKLINTINQYVLVWIWLEHYWYLHYSTIWGINVTFNSYQHTIGNHNINYKRLRITTNSYSLHCIVYLKGTCNFSYYTYIHTHRTLKKNLLSLFHWRSTIFSIYIFYL